MQVKKVGAAAVKRALLTQTFAKDLNSAYLLCNEQFSMVTKKLIK
jgi:hypothetical protein